jgi:hypothetical protein
MIIVKDIELNEGDWIEFSMPDSYAKLCNKFAAYVQITEISQRNILFSSNLIVGSVPISHFPKTFIRKLSVEETAQVILEQ